MSENVLAVEIRTDIGKGAARKLRREGRVPAILYGHGNQPTMLALDPRRLETILRSSEKGLNTLIDLQGDPTVSGKMVLVKDLQREPVNGSVLHADLFEIDLAETVEISVPVHLHGTPRGVSIGGGMMDQALREVELECLPGAIPDELVLDVSEMDIGDSLHVRDIPLPEGVSLTTDGDLSVVSVVLIGVEEEAAAVPAAEGEAAAPEGETAPSGS